MIAKYYGRSYSIQYLREQAFITREGVSMLGISDAAERIGFRTMGVKVTLEQLRAEVPLPCVLHWNQNHFVVLYKVKNGKYYIADPATKKLVYEESDWRVAGAAPLWKEKIREQHCSSSRDLTFTIARRRIHGQGKACLFSSVI